MTLFDPVPSFVPINSGESDGCNYCGRSKGKFEERVCGRDTENAMDSRSDSRHTMGFPGGSAGKESVCNAGVLGSIPGLGRYPREGNGYPLQYSGLENSMDCIAHGVAKSQT